MNAGEDGEDGEVPGATGSRGAEGQSAEAGAKPDGRQRLRALLAERARLLQPSTEFYARVAARTILREREREPAGGREPSTGALSASAPTYAAERAGPTTSTPETVVPVKRAEPDARAERMARKAEAAEAVERARRADASEGVERARRADASEAAERVRKAEAEAAAERSRQARAQALARSQSSSPEMKAAHDASADAAGVERTEIEGGPIRDASGEVMAAGRIIAGYRIEHQLGRGGMGEVYRATQLSVGRPVALKVLGKRLAGNPDFRERFLREARAAGRLHHQNLIAVHDVGEAGGLMFFSMELIEGKTLKALRADGPMTAELAISIIRQVLMALDYAHSRGVVHRDIKPDNIMISNRAGNAVVKVADLGLSRVDTEAGEAGHDPDLGSVTEHGAVMGTPHYMAPEQGRDAHSADLRADLWSVGATWYFLHYGRPPFTGGNAMDVLLKSSTEDVQFPPPAPPPAVCLAIARLMSRDPALRPASAAATLAMIDALEGHGARRKRAARRQRQWWQWAAMAAAVLIGVLTVTWAVRRYSHAVWWQGEHERIEAMATDGHYGEAMAVLRDDQDLLNPGAEADAGTAYGQDLEARWEKYAQDQTEPMFARFDRDLNEHQYKEAQATLRQIPESLLCPPVKAAVERRGEALEQALMDAADQSAQPATATDPNQRYQQATEELRREEVALAAERFWRAFACVPSGTPVVEDGAALFQGVGHGKCDLRSTGPLAQMRTRFFALRLHPSGTWSAEERWELDLGGAKLAMTSAGIELAETGKPARLLAAVPAQGEAVLHLRRSGTGWLCRVDPPKGKTDGPKPDEPWSPIAGGEVLEVAWSLSDGNTLVANFTGRVR